MSKKKVITIAEPWLFTKFTTEIKTHSAGEKSLESVSGPISDLRRLTSDRVSHRVVVTVVDSVMCTEMGPPSPRRNPQMTPTLRRSMTGRTPVFFTTTKVTTPHVSHIRLDWNPGLVSGIQGYLLERLHYVAAWPTQSFLSGNKSHHRCGNALDPPRFFLKIQMIFFKNLWPIPVKPRYLLHPHFRVDTSAEWVFVGLGDRVQHATRSGRIILS